MIVKGELQYVIPVPENHKFGDWGEYGFHVKTELRETPLRFKQSNQVEIKSKPSKTKVKAKARKTVSDSEEIIEQDREGILREYEFGRSIEGIAYSREISRKSLTNWMRKQGIRVRSKQEAVKAKRNWRNYLREQKSQN